MSRNKEEGVESLKEKREKNGEIEVRLSGENEGRKKGPRQPYQRIEFPLATRVRGGGGLSLNSRYQSFFYKQFFLHMMMISETSIASPIGKFLLVLQGRERKWSILWSLSLFFFLS